jgi:thiosulfate sulfurtransferase
MSSISAQDLVARLKEGASIQLIDVRRSQAVQNSGLQISGAKWLNPALWLDWKDEVSKNKPVILYCAHGHEISQGLTAALRVMGLDASYVVGGFSAWQEENLPVDTISQTFSS